MLAIVYDDNFEELSRERKKTKGFEGEEAGLDRIKNTIRKAMDEANVDDEDIAGIGIGCPGPIDMKRGVILEAPNLGWEKVQVRKSLEEEFDCPVSVVNDVDAGVYGEYLFGAAQDAFCVVGIFPGTGIGGGCVYDGKIFRGAKNTCMEIGHVPLVSDGQLDGCGNPGTVEAVASRLSIAGAAAQAAYRGQAPTLKKIAGTEVGAIRSGAIAQSIKGGDEAVKAIVQNAAEHLGMAIVSIVHLLSPDIVVMGGGLVEAMPELFVKEAQSVAKKRVLGSFKETFKVVAAQLGDDAAVQGAAAWTKKEASE